MKPFVGIDLGGTRLTSAVRAAVVDTASGRVLAAQRCLTLADEG